MIRNYPAPDIRKLRPFLPSYSDVVAIDALSLPAKFSGAANYIFNLVISLLRQPRGWPLAIFCREDHTPLFRKHLSPADRLVAIKFKNQLQKLIFYEFHLNARLQQEQVTLFYATHYLCPPRHPDIVLINTFHDMGFIKHPRFYPLHKRAYFGRRLKTFLERSDAVVAVSNSTASQIRAFFPNLNTPVTVIPPGADHLHHIRAAPFVLPTDQPIMLAVNTFEKRKNIPFVIKVFNQLKSRFRIPHRLVIVGQSGNAAGEIAAAQKRSPFHEEIELTQFVRDQELVRLYRQCDLFINASVYEGFGFTPFEAIGMGRPVFLYGNDAVLEFLGPHPYIFDHLDASRWAEAIWRAYRDGYPQQLTSNQICHLNWTAHAEKVSGLIEKHLQQKGVPVAL